MKILNSNLEHSESSIISIKKKIKNSLKDLNKTRKDFERKKESLIQEIEGYCKNQKTLEFNDDVFAG